MRIFFTLLLWAIPLASLFCQEGLGLNPPGMKWRLIETATGRIIFPEGMDSLAFRTAALVNYQRRNDSNLVGTNVTRRVSQIIQNQSVLPAGFSTPAPWRNEYYVTPPANMFLGPVSWADAMELHEYRHAQQFSMANQGLTWPYKILMGQTGWLLNSLITQPLWFREGDGVLAETIFTHGGRGRLPSFHMEYRALRLAGYHYDYEKAHYISLRDFVPNPYRIGYYLVTKARRDYGNDIWNKVLLDTYNKKGFFYPFSRSLRKFTGLTTKEFYKRSVEELDSVWAQEDQALTLTKSKLLSHFEGRKYTNYRLPQFVHGDSMVVLKSSLDLIPTYYVITPDGREQKLFSPGRYTDDHVTLVAEQGKMVWAESGFHERYINKDYSIIKVYDFKSGNTRKLTSKTRYFSPALSKDGTRIFVTETDYQNHYFHLIIDAATGAIMSRVGNPDGIFLSHPRWMDDENLVCVALSQEGNAVVRLNIPANTMSILVPFTHVPLSRPFAAGDHVYFSKGDHGINNIYALRISTGKIYQVTSTRFGAFEPVVSGDGRRLVFSEYTADGYRIHEMPLDSSLWSLPRADTGNLDFFLRGVSNSEEQTITDSAFVPEHYEVKKFNAMTQGLFNFYGWLVLPNIPEYGVEVYTQNIMSTLRGTVGVLYNTNENGFHYYARATYAALYPIIEFEYNRGNRRTSLVASEDPVAEPFDQPWREDVISAGVRFPFRLTQGTHNTTLTLEGRFEHYNVSVLDTADTENVLRDHSFNASRASLIFSRLKMQAPQQFRPRWGQVFESDYREGVDVEARRFQANALLYFPGLFRTHSLNFRSGFKEEKVVNAYRFTDNFLMPRGYEPFPFEDIRVASANYEMPLLYPDLSLGSVAFIQRIRTNLFFDYGVGNLNDREFVMRCPGAELYADFRLFRLVQMSLCFRFNFPVEIEDESAPDTQPFQFIVTRFELAN